MKPTKGIGVFPGAIKAIAARTSRSAMGPVVHAADEP